MSRILTAVFLWQENKMAQYCDSTKLEHNWLLWIIASAVPTLEPYRQRGLLWTKIVGVVKDSDGKDVTKNGKNLPDPAYPIRSHCLLMRDGEMIVQLHFESNSGSIPELATIVRDGKDHQIALPISEEKSLLPSHETNSQYIEISQELQRIGYILEVETEKSWHKMLDDINKMCIGIANKFNQPSEEDRNELANEALYQVLRKLTKGRLVYTPGKAPVFNLLTTTIHRCMFSIMNKRSNQRNGMHKLFEALKSGSIPTNQRSFRIQAQSQSKIKTKQ